MSIFTTNIEHDGAEMEATVYYCAHPAYPGRAEYRGGPLIDPPESAWIEIDYVYAGDIELDLSPDMIKKLQEEIGDMLAERAADVPDRDRE